MSAPCVVCGARARLHGGLNGSVGQELGPTRTGELRGWRIEPSSERRKSRPAGVLRRCEEQGVRFAVRVDEVGAAMDRTTVPSIHISRTLTPYLALAVRARRSRVRAQHRPRPP